MIMEIAESIFKFILASLNVCALAFTLILVSKWHIRMENKLDDIERYVRHVSDRNDIVYPGFFKFFAKSRNCYDHGVFVNVFVNAPHRVDKFLLAENLILIERQKVQNFELFCGEIERLAVDFRLKPFGRDHKRAEVSVRVCRGTVKVVITPYLSVYPAHHFLERERLRDIVVRAKLKKAYLVFFRNLRRNDDNGYVHVAPDTFANLVSVGDGHHYVQ